jgi:hypothetical protein
MKTPQFEEFFIMYRMGCLFYFKILFFEKKYIFNQPKTKTINMKENQPGDFKRELGLLDGTMLVVGSMIGSGIFIVSADIASNICTYNEYSRSNH